MPSAINPNDEIYQRLGQELADQLGRSDGVYVAKSLHTQLEQDGNDWFDGHVMKYFTNVPDNQWPDQKYPGHGYLGSLLMCTDAIWFYQSVRGIVAARELCYVTEDKTAWFSQWLLRVNIGEEKTKLAAEAWLPTYQQADSSGQKTMFIATLGAYLPDIPGKLPLLGAYAGTLDVRVRATTAMAFGDVANARSLQTEANALEEKLDAAIELYDTGGGYCYVLENDQGLLLRKLDGQSLFCIWSDEEDAEEMNRGRYKELHRVSPMSYRELDGQLEQFYSAGIQFVLLDQRMTEEGKIVPIQSMLALVKQQIASAESSEAGKAVKYLLEE